MSAIFVNNLQVSFLYSTMISHGLESLKNEQFIGQVIDNADPESCGRCRVRVFHLMNDIEDPYIPWACPKYNSSFGTKGSGSVSVPKVGTIVAVEFNCGDLYSPEYYGISNADASLVDNIKKSPEGTNILASDRDNSLLMAFNPLEGLFNFFNESSYGIRPDSSLYMTHNKGTSNLELKDNQVIITSNDKVSIGGDVNKEVNVKSNLVKLDGTQGVEIKGSAPNEYAVNANALLTLLSSLADMIDAKEPATPGAAKALVNSMRFAIINNKIRYI